MTSDVPPATLRQRIVDAAEPPALLFDALPTWRGNRLLLHWHRKIAEAGGVKYSPLTHGVSLIETISHFTETDQEWVEYYTTTFHDIQEARESALEFLPALLDLTIVGPDERPKHWPPGSSNANAIRDMVATDGESRFFLGITPDRLESTVVKALLDDVDICWPPQHRFYILDAMTVVGASLAGDTPYIKVDLSLSAGVFHAYPVPASEWASSPEEARLASDELQGFANLV